VSSQVNTVQQPVEIAQYGDESFGVDDAFRGIGHLLLGIGALGIEGVRRASEWTRGQGFGRSREQQPAATSTNTRENGGKSCIASASIVQSFSRSTHVNTITATSTVTASSADPAVQPANTGVSMKIQNVTAGPQPFDVTVEETVVRSGYQASITQVFEEPSWPGRRSADGYAVAIKGACQFSDTNIILSDAPRPSVSRIEVD
jgi:hypothetical protein